MEKKSFLTFSDGLGGTISLTSKLIFWGLKTLGIPHLGTRIRLYLLSRALKEINIKRRATVLDAGSGYGFISFNLAAKNLKVIGVDSDPKRIRVAQNLSKILDVKGIDFVKANLYQLPFPDKTFDLSLCLEVLEHLDDDKKALKELFRVTKDKGNLIVSFPELYADIKDFRKLGHVRSGYTIDFFKDMAKKAGFKIRKVYPYRAAIGKIILGANFRAAQLSPILSLIIFPLMYPLLIIDQNLPLGKAANFLVVLFKESS